MFKEISKVEGSFVIIDGTSLSTKPIISNQLKGAQFAAIFISTIGNGPELLSKELFDKGDGLEAYVVSLVASGAADSHAAHIHKHIEYLAEVENMGITNRFSPGYCKWDVAEQKKIFSFFETNAGGVTINESALMSPIKSVSGIIGIGKDLKLKEYPCKACTEDKCLYREK
jgi:cobalamin-dependent methionine synthase I